MTHKLLCYEVIATSCFAIQLKASQWAAHSAEPMAMMAKMAQWYREPKVRRTLKGLRPIAAESKAEMAKVERAQLGLPATQLSEQPYGPMLAEPAWAMGRWWLRCHH